MTKIVITGGGTAGHTNPGIAVGLALLDAGLAPQDVHFVGGERGNEGELVAAAGFSIDLLPGRGLLRSFSPAAIRQNLSSALGLLQGVRQAFSILSQRKPDAVLCLGGYAAFPTTLAALLLRTPIVVSEQNARASAVNRLFGRVAKACALPYPDTDLPGDEVTGNPILPDVVDLVANTDQRGAREELTIDAERIVIAVWAGSLGARTINRAVAELATQWSHRSDLVLYHVVGRRDWSDHRDNGVPGTKESMAYRVVEYETQMPFLLRAADIAVCRGGASTAAELAVAGLPAILIPLPGAPRDHQRANGTELVTAGGAMHLDDDQVSAERLKAVLTPLIDSEAKRQEMGDASLSVARPRAAHDVAAILLREGGAQ